MKKEEMGSIDNWISYYGNRWFSLAQFVDESNNQVHHYLNIGIQLVILTLSTIALLKFLHKYRTSINELIYGYAHLSLILLISVKAALITFPDHSFMFRVSIGFTLFSFILLLLKMIVSKQSEEWNRFGDLEEGSLHLAAMSGDNQKILKLISDGANPNVLGRDLWDGYPPIFAAIHQGLPQTILTLLREGADPNWKWKNGTSPLHFSIRMYHLMREGQLLDCFNVLMSWDGIQFDTEAKAEDVDASIPARWSFHLDDDRRRMKKKLYSGTPLSMAVKLGCNQMAVELIRRGAEVGHVIIDFGGDYRYHVDSLLPLKLLHLSGFADFPRDCNLIQPYDSFQGREEEVKFREFKEWIKSVGRKTLSLKEFSRASIRGMFGTELEKMKKLNLPKECVEYLLFKDVIP